LNNLLKKLRTHDGLLNQIIQLPLNELEFRNRCLELEKNEMLVDGTLLDMCQELAATRGPPVDLGSLVRTILRYHEDLLDFNKMQDIQSGGPPETRPLVSGGWDTAWDTDYEERALENFLHYLDVLWGQRRANWKPCALPTKSSYCASIVQSSCAGKSRLVSA
jgi:hypothetical protein